MRIDRRTALGGLAAAGLAQGAFAQTQPGPFEPNWASLTAGYRTPDWFRDAKFGIWAHWGPQSVPEQGDWYGRFLYQQGHPMSDYHRAHYGHPADFGMKDIQHLWTAAKWEPEALMARYKKAGAKYFVSLACHHDNFDCYDSAHHGWNALRIGPKRDVVGTWARVAREAGLRFGVSNHAGHAWQWFQTAYSYDPEGPRAGERYDAFTLTEADGKGTWWEGLDPRQLYTQPAIVAPPGIRSIKEMEAWRDAHWDWSENAPAGDPAYAPHWLARQTDLVTKYRPDFAYFDNHGVPFGGIGMQAIADYYNRAAHWHRGAPDVVATIKSVAPWQRAGVTEDIERGYADGIRALPWQTDTCIGDWFYNAARPRDRSYKSAEAVIQRLADVVSKNGNLLLSIPQRGDGTIDSEEEAILDALAGWMAVNGEAIFGTRPWRIYGEGPTAAATGAMNEGAQQPFTAQDVRFTTRDGSLYALLLAWPAGASTIAALAGGVVERVTLLGNATLPHRQARNGLHITLPARPPGGFVPVLRIEGRGLDA